MRDLNPDPWLSTGQPINHEESQSVGRLQPSTNSSLVFAVHFERKVCHQVSYFLHYSITTDISSVQGAIRKCWALAICLRNFRYVFTIILIIGVYCCHLACFCSFSFLLYKNGNTGVNTFKHFCFILSNQSSSDTPNSKVLYLHSL